MSRPGTARGRLLSVACGAALVAVSFVPLWASYRVPGLGLFAPETVYRDAWDAYGRGMELALALAAVVAVLALVAGLRPVRATRRWDALAFGLSVAALLAMLGEAVAGPQGSSDPNGYGISRGVLLLAGMGLACGMTYGGYLALRAGAPDGPTERADRGE